MACHPRFSENGYLYFYYTTIIDEDPLHATSHVAIVRYTCPGPSRRKPDPLSRTVVFLSRDSGSFHIGGWLDFGPDGLLYCAIGDRRDPLNAQDMANPRGKVLRLDVDRDDFPAEPLRNYGIPPGNPFASGGGMGEIFLWGLRNPFRCGFDSERRVLYVGDVGEVSREEISAVAIDGPGQNMGWPCYEGTLPMSTGSCSPGSSLVFPFIEYRSSTLPPLFRGGSSVIAGGAYTGCAIPALRNRVLLMDYTWRGDFYSLVLDGGVVSQLTGHISPTVINAGTPGFARDGVGEIYLVTGTGLFKIIALTAQNADINSDGVVNTVDLVFFLGRFGQPVTTGSPAALVDFNNDGSVNTPDLTYFLGRFGATCP